MKAIIDQNAFKMAYDSITNIYDNLVPDKPIDEISYIPCSLYLENNLPNESPEKNIKELSSKLDKEFLYDLGFLK